MKEGDILCWQFWDVGKCSCYSSICKTIEATLKFYPTIIPLCYWRIKKLKQ